MCALGSPRRLMLLAMTFNVYVFFAIMLGFALGALLTGHWNDPKGAHQSPSPTEVITLHVTGMACDACAGQLERALCEVKGVSGATVDFQNGSATVTGVRVSAVDLLAAVEACGQTASVVKATNALVPTPVDSGVQIDTVVLLQQPEPAIEEPECCR